jgi:uncharacterized membrane protein YhhN
MILPLFAAVAAVEVVAVAADWTAVQWVAKPLLGPLLIAYMIKHGRRDVVTLALVFATAGDIALLVPGQAAFLTGMGFFLGAQICFVTAFRPLRKRCARWRRQLPGSPGASPPVVRCSSSRTCSSGSARPACEPRRTAFS